MKPPIVGICSNPLIGMRPHDLRAVRSGLPISSLAPVSKGRLVCRINGEWMLRASWESLTRDNDIVEFYDLPEDKEDIRGLLQVAAIVASFIPGLQPFAIYIYAANAAYNLLVPPSTPRQPARPQDTGGGVFSTNLTGNTARLDQPIWRICGRREINPPFAAQPYFEFLPRVGAEDPDLDREQYYYALFAVGIGDYNVIAKIGNTPISRFADVLTAEYLPPGVAPTAVAANVTTADEVSSQVMESGRYVGGFAACAPRRTCAFIGIDVVATRGLGKTGALTVSWRVETRPINDFGQILGAWTVLATESRTAFTSTPQRWSNKYTISTPARLEVRVVRTDIKDEDPAALHEIAWTGLRAYLAEPAPLNPHASHYQVVMRASSQLSQNASRDLRLITYGKARELDESLVWSSGEVPTRNGPLYLLDLITSDTWGINKPDDRVDLASFRALAVTADERQDRFDYVFDSTMNAWDAMQLIARSCRARVFRRNGVISVARDELADLSVTAFTPRNCAAGMHISEKLRQRRTPDGIVVEYQDHRTWEWTPIECPCPGVIVMTDPVRIRLEGVVGATHAQREGLYEAANLLYRTRVAEWTTEMQGQLPAYLSPVDFIADTKGYGASGDVAFWDDDTLTLTLTEPVDFTAGPLFLTLIRDDGTLTEAVEVAPGDTPNEVVLPEAPDFVLVLDRGDRERPKYLLGVKDVVRVMAIEDGGKSDEGAQLYALRGVIDDERVHTADVALLPGPGDIQDPVGDPDDAPDEGGGGGGEELVIVNVEDYTVTSQAQTGIGDLTLDIVATYRLRNNGTTEWETDNGSFGHTGPITLARQWSYYGELETATAALFEVRATVIAVDSAAGNEVFTGSVGSWVSFPAEWSLTSPFVSDLTDRITSYTLFIEIREVASGIVQDSGNVTLLCTVLDPGG